jgi:hypothetical protein
LSETISHAKKTFLKKKIKAENVNFLTA